MMELLIAIRDSATRGGVPVTLPLTDVTEHERRLHAEFQKAYGLDFVDLEPEHLRLKYTLPPGLKDFLYLGRVSTEN